MLQLPPILSLAFGVVVLLSPASAQQTYSASAEACSDPNPFPGRFCLINSQVCCFAPDICMDGTTTCIQAGGSAFPPGNSGQPGPGPLPSPPMSSGVVVPIPPPVPAPTGNNPIPGGESVVPTPGTSLSVSVPSTTVPTPGTSLSVPVPSTTSISSRPSTVTPVPTTHPSGVGPAPTPNNSGGVKPAANITSGTSGNSTVVQTGPAIFTGAATPLRLKGVSWLVMWGLSVIIVGVGIFT